MNARRFRTLLASGFVWVVPGGWLILEFARGYRPHNGNLLFIMAAIVTLGELLEVDLRGGRSTPVSAAVVFALFVVLPEPADVGLVVLPAYFVGMLVMSRAVGRGPRFRSTSRRLASTTLAFIVYTLLRGIGLTPSDPRDALLAATLAMVAAGFVELVLDTGASAALIARTQRIPGVPIFAGQISNRLGLHGAFLSVAALMVLAHSVLGEMAFMLFLLPLIAARYSFRRYASIHKTYVQTIRALSKVPELANYAPRGHSARVAQLATAMARRRGLSDNEVQDIEFAALMHDVGLVSFDDPSDQPESVAGTRDGYRLALASARIVGKTPYLQRVARIVEHQDTRVDEGLGADIPIGARIVRVANDFVELTEPGGPSLPSHNALDQLAAGAGTEYDERVLEALAKVVTAPAFA